MEDGHGVKGSFSQVEYSARGGRRVLKEGGWSPRALVPDQQRGGDRERRLGRLEQLRCTRSFALLRMTPPLAIG